MARFVTFGIGGYDPTKPNDNVVEVVETDDVHEPLQGIQLVAALNAALGVWSVTDAANISGASAEQLEKEVLSWAAAMELNDGD